VHPSRGPEPPEIDPREMGLLHEAARAAGRDLVLHVLVVAVGGEQHGELGMAAHKGAADREAVVVAETRLVAMSVHLFAGLRVRDFHAALPWYERLLGEPAFFPNDIEAVWTLADERSVYIVEHPEGAGRSVVTLFLDDLDAWVDAIAARGLEPDERLTYDNGVRKAHYHDADGNEIAFGGPPEP
jgi:hypothetical protein